MLIREITRRVNLEGIFQAVYTAGVVLPKPVATCRYLQHLYLAYYLSLSIETPCPVARSMILLTCSSEIGLPMVM